MLLPKEQIKIAFDQAEKEAKDLQQRTKEGMEVARSKGKQIARAEGTTIEYDIILIKIYLGESMMTGTISRGDLIYADLSPAVGSEQGGIRPVVVIQNDVGNRYSPTVIVAAITSHINKAKLPTHVEISANEYSLNKDSVVILEQIRTLDKKN